MLSGGERGRLHLAKTLIQGGNVLLLDEPSNDLDVETLRALEDALLEYAGTVLVISHDRWFLDRIATHPWPLKVTANGRFLTAITKSTKPTRKSAWAKKVRSPSACVTRRSSKRSNARRSSRIAAENFSFSHLPCPRQRSI